jgi:hypothetical protein
MTNAEPEFSRTIPVRTPNGADVLIALILFVASAAIAAWYVPFFSNSGGKPWFYQEQFGPAVMAACGHGYVNPNTPAVPGLDAFLKRTRDSISCSEVSVAPTLPLASMQRAFRYLMLTVGWTWRIRGQVAWSALTPLYSLLYGITVALAYFIFRQGVGRLLSAAAASALAVSTLHLNNLPHLRDYGKAPFVLALVLIAMRLVVPPLTTRRTLRLAVIAGLVTGIGVGFRNDLLVAIPACMAVFAFFLPAGVFERIGLRASAIAVYAATVFLAMAPMWSTYTTGGGNSSQHLVLLGLGEPFTEELGIDNSHLYQWAFDYRDELAQVMISDYADRRLGQHELLQMYGPDYDRAGSKYLSEIAGEFPADMLVRAYASALSILELPYSATTTSLMPPAFVGEPHLRFPRARTWVLRRLTPFWPWMYGITLLALSLTSVRLGLFAGLFVLYVSGYPALQFQERHFFHLEFIGWWAFAFALSLAGQSIRALVVRERRIALVNAWRPARGWPRAVAQALALWCVLGAAIVGPLWVLRRYQQGHARVVLQAIVDAPRDEVPTLRSRTGDGLVRLETPSLAPQLEADHAVHTAYLVAEFGGGRCETLKLDMTYRYAATERAFDFTRTVQVQPPLSDRPVQIFLPAYFRRECPLCAAHGGFGLTGVELPESAAGCLTSLSTVRDSARIPVLLDLHLRPHWESATLYGTIAGVESRVNPDEFPEVHTFPPDLAVKRSLLMTEPDPFHQADVARQSRTFQMLEHEWKVAGVGGVGGRGPFLYLVEMKPRVLKKDSYVIAQGLIEKGGLSFGIVRGDEWVAQVPFTHPGPFAVVVKVPEDAEYKVVLANNLIGTSLDNRLVVTRAGVIAAAPDGSK